MEPRIFPAIATCRRTRGRERLVRIIMILLSIAVLVLAKHGDAAVEKTKLDCSLLEDVADRRQFAEEWNGSTVVRQSQLLVADLLCDDRLLRSSAVPFCR